VQNDHGWSPLMKSVWHRRKKSFDVIMKQKKVAVNAVNRDGLNALHLAAAHGIGNMCAVLLERGADFNAKDLLNKTPLYYAKNYENGKTCAAKIAEAEKKDNIKI